MFLVDSVLGWARLSSSKALGDQTAVECSAIGQLKKWLNGGPKNVTVFVSIF